MAAVAGPQLVALTPSLFSMLINDLLSLSIEIEELRVESYEAHEHDVRCIKTDTELWSIRNTQAA